MTSERHARAKEIFLSVLAKPAVERVSALESICGDDRALRDEVEQLLAHHDERTITPSSAAETVPTEAWRRTGPKMDLDAGAGASSHDRQEQSSPDREIQDLTPGTVLGGRYRIVSQLGRGGMGVVYRAEDLTLDQTVALKFLNPSMSRNVAWLQRFRNEVRMARAVTHPNVCRVFDIGEVDERHYLSMEYVDGEDLTSLLRRIGRLPREKAIDIARQICIGLAAAHGAGVLHRDLKPANIMLDGNGRVRITDFGLAVAPDSVESGDLRAGTPAYMAPEQITGRSVSIQSDIYSLGLVLYELFSGRSAFDAASIEEFVELHQNAQPRPLSEFVPDVDTEVERIIDSCLRKHAADRPSSAIAVAAALPGTDPLAVALAANLTPSPEMVAAASTEYEHSIAKKYLVLCVVILIAGFAAARDYSKLPWERSDSKSPVVLADQARELLAGTPFAAGGQHWAHGYCDIDQALAMATGSLGGAAGGSVLAAGVDSSLVFWYRQSENMLVPADVENLAFGSGRVTPLDPSPLTAGSAAVALDLSGRLLLLVARPARSAAFDGPTSPSAQRAFLERCLELAGIRESDLTITASAENPNVLAKRGSAWLAPDPRGLDESVRVEASLGHESPLLFAVCKTDRSAQVHEPLADLQRRESLSKTSLQLLLLSVTTVAVPWAWRNLRSRRSDRRGALKIAVLVGSVELVVWLLRASHTLDFSTEILRACLAVMRALGTAALVAVFYTALEPYARRHWPQMLIAWSRALSGNLRDPVVGEHVLIGVCLGSFWSLLMALERVVVGSFGWEVRPSVVGESFASKLISMRIGIADYLDAIPFAIILGLLFLLLLAALRALLRRPRLAAICAVVALLPFVLPRGAHPLTTWVVMGIGGAGLGVWLMARFGLLTLTTALFVMFVLNTSPITLDPSAWYFDTTLCAVMIIAGIAIFGLSATRERASLG